MARGGSPTAGHPEGQNLPRGPGKAKVCHTGPFGANPGPAVRVSNWPQRARWANFLLGRARLAAPASTATAWLQRFYSCALRLQRCLLPPATRPPAPLPLFLQQADRALCLLDIPATFRSPAVNGCTPGFLIHVFLTDQGNRRFWGVWAAPGGPKTLQKGGEAKPPTFSEGFPAARGRPDLTNRRFPLGQKILY